MGTLSELIVGAGEEKATPRALHGVLGLLDDSFLASRKALERYRVEDEARRLRPPLREPAPQLRPPTSGELVRSGWEALKQGAGQAAEDIQTNPGSIGAAIAGAPMRAAGSMLSAGTDAAELAVRKIWPLVTGNPYPEDEPIVLRAVRDVLRATAFAAREGTLGGGQLAQATPTAHFVGDLADVVAGYALVSGLFGKTLAYTPSLTPAPITGGAAKVLSALKWGAASSLTSEHAAMQTGLLGLLGGLAPDSQRIVKEVLTADDPRDQAVVDRVTRMVSEGAIFFPLEYVGPFVKAVWGMRRMLYGRALSNGEAEALLNAGRSIMPTGPSTTAAGRMVEAPAGAEGVTMRLATPEEIAGAPLMERAPAGPTMIDLRHRTPARLTEVNPELAGTGPIRGAERSRAGAVPVGFFQRAGTEFEKGFPESFNEYAARVPQETLFDVAGASPEMLDQARQLAAETGDHPASALTKIVRQQGYRGFYNSAHGGDVVALFDKTPVVPVREAPLASPATFEKIAQLHAERGGSSVTLAGEDLAGKPGFAVSVFPGRGVVLDHPPNAADIAAFVQRNADVLSAHEGAFVGTWEKGGKHYLDVSVRVPSQEGALALGRHHGEQAIYDLEKGADVEIPAMAGIGEHLESAAMAARDRLNERGGSFRMTAGIPDPADVKDLSVIGAAYLYRGVSKPELWDKAMVAAVGESVRDHLPALRQSSERVFETQLRAVAPSLRSINEVGQMALEGADNQAWYARVRESLSALGPEKEQKTFVGFLAALSPQMPVERNVEQALVAFARWKAGLPIEDIVKGAASARGTVGNLPRDVTAKKFQQIIDAVESGKDTAVEAIMPAATYRTTSSHHTGEAGEKVNAFFRNLWHSTRADDVTIDGWMYKAFGVERYPRTQTYNILREAIRQEAAERGVAPSELQAMIWAGMKRRVEGPMTVIEPVRKTIQRKIDEAIKRGELKPASPQPVAPAA